MSSVCFCGLFHFRFKNTEHLAKLLSFPALLHGSSVCDSPYNVLHKILHFIACSKMMVQKHSCQFSFSNFHFLLSFWVYYKCKSNLGEKQKKEKIWRDMWEGKEICRALSWELHQVHRKIGVAVGQFGLCLYCLTQQQFNLIVTLQLTSLRVQLCKWDQSKLNETGIGRWGHSAWKKLVYQIHLRN